MSVLSSGSILPTLGAESLPQDDIDRLFEKLHKLEPPNDIVKQILARVKRLPAPSLGLDEELFPAENEREAAE